MNTFLKNIRTRDFKYELEAIIVRFLLPLFIFPQVLNIRFFNQPEFVQGKLHYRVNTIVHVNNILNILKGLLKKNPIIITAIWKRFSAPVLQFFEQLTKQRGTFLYTEPLWENLPLSSE